MNFTRHPKVLSFKLFREYLIWVCFWRVQALFTWCHCLYSFLFFEGLNKVLPLLCSLLLLYFIKIYYLLVVLGCSEWSCFYKVTKDRRFCKLVDKRVRLWTIFLGSKLLKIEAISRIYSVWNYSIRVVYVFEKFSVIGHYFWHEL